MPDTEASNSPALKEESQPLAKQDRSSLWAALAVAIFLVGALSYWYSLDHHIPEADEAGHILSSLSYQDLYLHMRPWRLHWWQQFLTVSSFYPPTTYIAGGLLKLVLNGSRSADVLIQCISLALLCLSTFACARFSGLSVLGATLAGLLIGLYPVNNALSHSFLLELPLSAAVAVGFVLLQWWQTKPGYRLSVLVGIGLSFACLTKQIVVCYLVPAGIYVLVASLLSADRSSRWQRMGQLATMVLTTVIVGLPWIVLNAGATTGLYAYNRDCLAASSLNPVQINFLANVSSYLKYLVQDCSPFMLAAALLSIIAAGLARQKGMGLLTCSGVVGVLFLSTYNGTTPLPTYIMAALIPLAVFTGLGCQLLIDRKVPWAKAIVAVFLLLALAQWVISNYTPYPLSSNKTMTNLVAVLRGLPADSPALHYCPKPLDDWGADEIIDLIKSVDKGNPAWLNILINQGKLNAHTFELIVKEKKSAVRPTTFLQWSLVGDRIEFSEEKCLYCKWHLVNSGTHGYKFFNTDSKTSWNKFKSYVSTSGKFSLKWSKHLPDGQTLYLYMRVP